jgi:hypothetical protein
LGRCEFAPTRRAPNTPTHAARIYFVLVLFKISGTIQGDIPKQRNRGCHPMSHALAEADHLEIVFHNDDETPTEFVIELLHLTFKKPIPEAFKFTRAIDKR